MYCRYECMVAHRRRLSASSGTRYRKLILRVGVHERDYMVRLWSIVRDADKAVRDVVILDAIMERDAIMREIADVAQRITPDERTALDKEYQRLEKSFSHDRASGARIECPECKAICGVNSALCWRCGRNLYEENVVIE